MQFNDIRVVASKSLFIRSYVTFYWNGKRVKEYNGNNIGLIIKPNLAKTVKERDKLLKQQEFELIKALESGSYQIQQATPEHPLRIDPVLKSAEELVDWALKVKIE